jgi:hypothetical protein
VIEQTKILTARRAYEFRPDDLRLSVLSVAQVHQQIQQFFSFQVGAVGTPQPTFGPIPNTLPPGVVLDFGTTQTPENVPTPMRFLHFEPRRIVIDVAGPSSAIDWTYEQIRRILAEVQSPDGSAVIGEPVRTRDYSEIIAHFDFDFEDLISGPLLELAKETFDEDGRSVLPLSLKFRAVAPDEEADPGKITLGAFSDGNALELRAGTRPQDRTFYSVTEMPTDRHLAWLEALDQRLSQQ